MNHYLQFWGKSGSLAGSWHPACYHSFDVAAVAWELLETGSVRRPQGWAEPPSVATIAALVAMHDIGKFSRPFQAQVKELWPTCLGPFEQPPASPRHDTAGAFLLTEPLADVLDLILSSWNADQRGVVIRAICGHHGRPPEELDGLPTILRDIVCQNAARAFVAAVRSVIGCDAIPPQRGATLMAFGWWLAGLTVLADWIGSNTDFFKPHSPGIDMAGYWADIAIPAARRAVAAAGVRPSRPRPRVLLADLVGRATAPGPVQALLSDIEIGQGGPLLAIVEDQTGSGKTEAALLLAHRLMAAGRADGLYIALPTMATANAMYERLHGAYLRLFDDGEHPSLVLAHGRRADHPGFNASILDAPAAAVSTDDPADETATAQCAAWIADDRRRTFLAEIGVGTIDQALLAVLPSRHAPLRLLGLSRRVLIVDEAHAYDAYMQEELARLVTFQTALGGNSVILSATLTQVQRAALVKAFHDGLGIRRGPRPTQIAYPQVTLARGDDITELACASRPELARSVQVERVATFEAIVMEIRAAVARGKAVAWVRNAVDDTIEAYDRLAEAGVDATLFHARFAMGDRLDIEQKVMKRFGRESNARAGVVVATQVIEQSLDIDFDLMVTDLAPIDLVIQRAGRLWRHQRPERPADQPRLLLFSPDPVAAPSADWLSGDWRRTGFVYDRIDVLWRTARELVRTGAILAPGDVRRLVEAVYAPTDPTPPGLERQASRAEGGEYAERGAAQINLLRFQDGYARNAGAWESDVHTPTRLSEPSLTLRLARWDGAVLTPLGHADTPRRAWSLSEVSVPLRRCKGVPEPAAAVARAIAAAKADWGAWEQDVPVLVLEQSKAAAIAVGRVLLGSGVLGIAGYDQVKGLLWLKFPH